ncbi:hypothetical protein ACP70R_038868 [Stipagrostis hirtigluma subsp. patula]
MAGRSNAAVVALVALVLIMAPAARAGLFKPCGVDQDALETCRAYCTVGSAAASPTQECCAAMGDADLACLCRNKATLLRMAQSQNIDAGRAMAIPYKCGITSAPFSC